MRAAVLSRRVPSAHERRLALCWATLGIVWELVGPPMRIVHCTAHCTRKPATHAVPRNTLNHTVHCTVYRNATHHAHQHHSTHGVKHYRAPRTALCTAHRARRATERTAPTKHRELSTHLRNAPYTAQHTAQLATARTTPRTTQRHATHCTRQRARHRARHRIAARTARDDGHQ